MGVLLLIILRKKRILLIISLIFISIFVYGGIDYIFDTKLEYTTTVALPVSNRVIIIDAGHGLPDRPEALVVAEL